MAAAAGNPSGDAIPMSKPILATLVSVVAFTAGTQAAQAQSTQQEVGAQSTLPPVIVKQKKQAADTPAPAQSATRIKLPIE